MVSPLLAVLPSPRKLHGHQTNLPHRRQNAKASLSVHSHPKHGVASLKSPVPAQKVNVKAHLGAKPLLNRAAKEIADLRCSVMEIVNAALALVPEIVT